MDIQDWKAMEEKWQRRWEQEKVFEAEPLFDGDGKPLPKFFLNLPYPYMNGYLHLGHTYSYMRGEVLARYKRMRGYNVLFPFAFHCTGSPIVSAADRVKASEPKQIKIMVDMGIPKEMIPDFQDPEQWAEYFPKEAKTDLGRLGLAIDWRRSFITTSLNPFYDSFIRWQFKKLHESDLVIQGEHPVVWCPKENSPVGDHSRIKGEGEVPTDFTLLKFKIDDFFFVAATLRPETVFGQTNLWLDPDGTYARIRIETPSGAEEWVVSEPCAKKLSEQGRNVEVLYEVFGGQFIGKECVAPKIKKAIPILPSGFCDPNKGTGIVTSVPSDAPDDWMGLYDLQRDREFASRHGLDWEKVKAIEPVPIIRSKGWGPLPAVEICQKMEIADQYDSEKLAHAKSEIYKSGFYTGVMTDRCGKYEGMPVEEAKELIKGEMLKDGEADLLWEVSGEVVCRCLTPCVVKLVSDQWFIAYGNKEWKKEVHSAIDNMKFLPDTLGRQFHNVVDWLRDWACTRELGLGTSLPWDERWLIESLSDSTIYMAYYILSLYLEHYQKGDAKRMNDAFFDLVLLGKGEMEEVSGSTGISAEDLEKIRRDVEYWYPFDYRGSGKDLIQNHLTFCVFNHTAIFPESMWPRGFGVNGFIRVEGEKMSKSLGNFYTLREVLDTFGADTVRFTLVNGGEGLDDPNWETELAKSIGNKFLKWLSFCETHHGKGRETMVAIDRWFLSVMNGILKDLEQQMELMNYKSAIKIGFYDLQNSAQWYLRRCRDEPSREVVEQFLSVQTRLLAPIVPHLAEEAWEKIGGEGLVTSSPWPLADETKISKDVETSEEFLKSTMEDISRVVKLVKEEPKEVFIYIYQPWQLKLFNLVVVEVQEGRAQNERKVNIGALIKKAMADEGLQRYKKDVPGYIQSVAKYVQKLGDSQLVAMRTPLNEGGILEEAKAFLEAEFGFKLTIVPGAQEDAPDPANRRKNAMPYRPGIYVS